MPNTASPKSEPPCGRAVYTPVRATILGHPPQKTAPGGVSPHKRKLNAHKLYQLVQYPFRAETGISLENQLNTMVIVGHLKPWYWVCVIGRHLFLCGGFQMPELSRPIYISLDTNIYFYLSQKSQQKRHYFFTRARQTENQHVSLIKWPIVRYKHS